MENLQLGMAGEDFVCKYLEGKKCFIVKRNFKCRYGEIDIIATDKNELVFVEVKTRSSKSYGEARESINNPKKKHIKKAAEFYIMKYGLEGRFVRFDVAEVYLKNGIFFIKYIKNSLW